MDTVRLGDLDDVASCSIGSMWMAGWVSFGPMHLVELMGWPEQVTLLGEQVTIGSMQIDCRGNLNEWPTLAAGVTIGSIQIDCRGDLNECPLGQCRLTAGVTWMSVHWVNADWPQGWPEWVSIGLMLVWLAWVAWWGVTEWVTNGSMQIDSRGDLNEWPLHFV